VKPQGYIPASASPSAHEGADLHIRNVVKVAALLAVVLVTSILILALFFRQMERLHPGRTRARGSGIPASPRAPLADPSPAGSPSRPAS
jgi:hypothetical protein